MKIIRICFSVVVIFGSMPIWIGHTQQETSFWVTAITWSPDGQSIAIGTDQSHIAIYNTDLQLITELNTRGGYIEAIRWSPDQTKLAIISDFPDTFLEVWRVVTTIPPTFIPLLSVGISRPEFPAMAWSSDNIHLASSSGTEAIIWNTDTGEQVKKLERHFSDINTIHWHSENQWLLTGDGRGTIRIWDTNNNYNLIRSFTNAWERGQITASVSPDENYIAIPTLIGNDDIGIWNINTGNRVDTSDVTDSVARVIRWGKNYLAILEVENVIKIVNPASWEVVNTISASNLVLDIAWSPDGTQLAYMEAGGTLQIISV